MGIKAGPIYLGDIRCAECNKVMVAVMGTRMCAMGCSYASKSTNWESILLPREDRISMLNELSEKSYISARNYKYAMGQLLGQDNEAVKSLQGEAVEPSSGFKLFGDSDSESEVGGFVRQLSGLFRKRKKSSSPDTEEKSKPQLDTPKSKKPKDLPPPPDGSS